MKQYNAVNTEVESWRNFKRRLQDALELAQLDDESLRADLRAALKRLFTDPHFNVMDGLDVYIDDYSKTEPIPPAMMAGLRQAQNILQWAKEDAEERKKEELEQIRGLDIYYGWRVGIEPDGTWIIAPDHLERAASYERMRARSASRSSATMASTMLPALSAAPGRPMPRASGLPSLTAMTCGRPTRWGC